MLLSKIKPTGFNVLVRPEKVENKTAGGIFLPDDVRDKEQHGVQRGAIIAIGASVEHLKAEDIGRVAIFGRYAGAFIKSGEEEYRLIEGCRIAWLPQVFFQTLDCHSPLFR